MSHQLVRMLVLAFVVLLVAPAIILAATETVSGMIQEVDMDKGSLIITTDDDKTRELIAPKELLNGLEPGDEVKIQIVDGKVTAINKDEKA